MSPEPVVQSNPSFLYKLKRTGPGLIIAAATIGPGSVTLACVAGSKYAYSLLWILVLGAIVRWVYQSMMYRTAIVAEKPLMKVIYEFKPWLAALTGVWQLFWVVLPSKSEMLPVPEWGSSCFLRVSLYTGVSSWGVSLQLF